MYLIYIFDVSYDRPPNCNERCEHVPRGHPSISVSCRKASTTLPAAKDAAREWFSRGLFLVAMALPGKVSWIGSTSLRQDLRGVAMKEAFLTTTLEQFGLFEGLKGGRDVLMS